MTPSDLAPEAGAGARAGEDTELAAEESLVARAHCGDPAALRQLLVRHAGALYSRVILPRAGDPTLAEDVLKETMVTAIEKLDTFTWQGRSIYFWLRQIAVRKVIDHHRRRGRADRLVRRLTAEPALDVLPAGSGPGPEAALIAAEERRINASRIQETLEAINPRYRRAIELRLVQERSRQRCAELMEVTVGTFDVLFFRALKAFRREYEGG